MNKLQRALALLERFERGEFIQPSEAESLLVQVFEACGEFATGSQVAIRLNRSLPISELDRPSSDPFDLR
jgi:hypothetical protein